MAVFQYRALATDGTLTEGVVDAGGRQEAYRHLEERGLKPVGLKEGAQTLLAERRPLDLTWRKKKVSYRALENFTRQLSSLLAAGIPLSRALQIVSREASTSVAREQWKEIYDQVIDGASLADSMARSPGTFPTVYVAMVQAGETGGFLDVVLAQIADFQAREKELRSRVISALIYPAILLTLAIGVLTFLMLFFIPRFKLIFKGFGGSLPLLTQIIVKISEVVSKYGLFVVLAVAVAGFVIRQWLRSQQGRRAWQQLVLRLPVIGPLNARFAMTRFCRMLGTLVGSGVSLIHALRVARESIGNQTLVDAVSDSIERVKQGDGLAASLSDCRTLFPGSVIEMITVAEETGRLDQELVRIAAATDSDLDRQLRTAVSLAEPLLLFVMAGFIGTIFIGMVLPIFSLQEYIK
jgi:type II secretory pathway component PulF